MTWRFSTTPEEMKEKRWKARQHSQQVSGLQKRLDELQRKVDTLKRYADEGQSVWEILRRDYPEVYAAVLDELRQNNWKELRTEGEE